MSTRSPFDLEAFIGSYTPVTLDAEQWFSVREHVVDAVRLLQPQTLDAARGLMKAIVRFLAHSTTDASTAWATLSPESINTYVARCVAAGDNQGSVQVWRRALNRVHLALHPEEGPAGRRSGDLPRDLNPYSPAELRSLEQKADEWLLAGDPGLAQILSLCAGQGVRPRDLIRHRIDLSTLKALQARLIELDASRLHLHRLRHTWLQKVLTQAEPVALVVTRHGLSSTDLRLFERVEPLGTAAGPLRSA